MGPLEIAIVLVIFLIVLVAIAVAVVLKFVPKPSASPSDTLPPKDEPTDRPWPYEKRMALLTDAELNFYKVLAQVLRHPTDPAGPPQCVIAMQVRVADVLKHKGGQNAGGNWRTYQNKIDRKHFDFVLVKPDTTEIVCAIELDDASHRKKDRQERDAFLEEACEDAGLPLLRVVASVSYDPNQIASNIRIACRQSN